ncbi:adenylyltransferase/cytidyltransferase family protein [Candidatus Woesearchaeota archaeon]|nr:adenylyltransferase/cytidyltransferase family protein [Candidatus Woesearchaeota archaeon]
MPEVSIKILSNDEIAKKSRGLKKQGKKVIMVNGVFDMLHIGHIGFLRKAKEKGDVLFVAVNSNQSVKSYKGENKPIIPEKERVLMLASLFFVDHVTIFNESKALNIIEKIKPDILVKGIRPDPERLEEENVTTSSGQIIDKIRGVSSEGINNSQ